MATLAYRSLTEAEKIYKALIWDTSIKAGEYVLEYYVPILAVTGIKQLWEGIVERVGDWIYKNLVLLVDVSAIKLVNYDHQAAYDQASVKLKIIAHDKGIDSDEFKKARDEAKIALSKFASFGK